MERLAYPKNNVRVTQLYVPENNIHLGVDFGGSKINDTRCWGVGNGVITETGFNKIRGFYVETYHKAHDLSCLYLHLDKILVAKGGIVTKNTIIGIEGDTGNTTGAHLHFGLYKGPDIDYYNDHVNPLDYLYLKPEQNYYVGDNDVTPSLVMRDYPLYQQTLMGLCNGSTKDKYKELLTQIKESIEEVL